MILECFCGMKFENKLQKRSHILKCDKYKEMYSKYLNLDYLKRYLSDNKYNVVDILKIYPYNMFQEVDVKNVTVNQKIPRFFVCKDGSRLTVKEINEILNYDFLYKEYVVNNRTSEDICDILKNKFANAVIIRRLKEFNIKLKNPTENYLASKYKYKKTCMEKYGVENFFQSKDFKEKSKETCLERYGVESYTKTQECKDKVKKTFLEKYGVDNNLKSQQVKDKIRKTNLEKFGVDNVFKLKSVQDRIKQTNIKKYGCEYPFQNKEIQEKYKKTCLEKYGYEHNFKDPNSLKKIFEDRQNNIDNGVLYSKESVELFNNITKNFNEDISSKFHYATHNGEEFIVLDDNFYSVDFSFINNDIKIAIEFNGDYWHANPKQYNKDETPLKPFNVDLTCQQIWDKDKKKIDDLNNNGFKTLVIWESDYLSNKEQVLNECCNFIKQNING